MTNQTEIQRRIEKTVTNDRGYDRKNTARTPQDLRNTELGLQIALANMDTGDGKLDMMEIIDFSPRVQAILKKFKEAGIPICVISDANGFDVALKSAYSFSGKFDDPYFGTYDSFRNVTYGISEYGFWEQKGDRRGCKLRISTGSLDIF